MANRLEPLNLEDFTGGLNLRASQFQLADNESPEMANITIDPLGGIYTRPGWEIWNDEELPVDVEDWDPRRAYMRQLSDGTDLMFIATNGIILMTSGTTEFTEATDIACGAVTHLADFAAYGDITLIACGREFPSCQRIGTGAVTEIVAASAGNWNDDYTTPVHGVFPRAELVETHAGYAFVANTEENSVDHPNRVRWSHPTSYDDWAENDYIDVGLGGSHITGLMSYEDHLLIFKPDGVWALYGYNLESWQLIQKSSTIGAVGPQGITRSETMAFFYSASDRGGIYAYNGERPVEISEQLRRAFADLISPELLWVGWVGRRLWVTVPWTYDGPTADDSAAFVFDPSVGNGAWTYYYSRAGGIGPIVGGSNIDSQSHPLAVLRNTETPCVVRLDALEIASDHVSSVAVIGASDMVDDWDLEALMTIEGAEIIADGSPGLDHFPTYYRTPWLTAGWPTRKKSWRRPDFVVRDFEVPHRIRVQSFRDYEEANARRQSVVEVTSPGGAIWGDFDWGDGTEWGTGNVTGSSIRRGSSFGMCRALQLRLSGITCGARWGVDSIITKLVLRRFR